MKYNLGRKNFYRSICVLSVVAVVALCLVALVGCSFNSQVTFDLNYAGSESVTQSVGFGKSAEFFTPQRENYIFGGWYTDSACNTPADESTAMFFSSVTYYAKWYPEIVDMTVICMKTVYEEDEISSDDFSVQVTFADGSSKYVDDFSADLTNATAQAGSSQVEFSYSENGSEFSTVYTLEVQPLVLTEISAVYNGHYIAVDGTTNSADFTVIAKYNSGKQKEVADFELSYDFSEEGERTVTVDYTENGVEQSCSVTVTVKPASEIPVELSAVWDGTEFEVGDSFKPSTLSVNVTFADEHTETLNSKQYKWNGFSSKSAGTVKITVSYQWLSQTVEVRVINKPLVSISAEYVGRSIEQGGELDLSDIIVVAVYETDYTAEVTDFSIENFSSENLGTQTVKITYTENDVTVSAEVEITIVEVGALSNGNLSVHFLELGNKYTGDCVYIKAGDVDILIDAGSKNDSGSTITSYLSNYVTDGKLEYVIVTHAHEDHISGFYGTNGVFTKYETETIIEFALTNKTSASSSTVYGKYVAARDNEVKEGATCYTAAQCFNETNGAQREYQLTDDISLEILYNYYYFNTQTSGENDYSVCIMIHQGENNYLFTGDLESGGEQKMVEYYENQNEPLPHCTLYKAGHHGSKTSSSAELMAAITPDYVCVCCCCGTSEYTDTNANQFPTQTFVNNVAPYTDKVYVTSIVDNYVDKSDWSTSGTVKSMNGNIVFTCNDGVVSVDCSASNTLLKDTEWFKENRDCPSAWASAVTNENTLYGYAELDNCIPLRRYRFNTKL